MYWAALVACVGCGRFGFDPVATIDATGPDALVLCTTWGPFSAPTRLTGPINTSTDDWEPAPIFGETEMFYEDFLGTSDLMHASRAGTDFDTGAVVSELSTDTLYERAPSLTDDGLTIVYMTNQADAGDLWIASRAQRSDAFGAPVPLANVNSVAYDAFPWISGDGLRLVFASERNGDAELFETTRSTRNAQFADPQPIAELETSMDEISPTLSADGLEIIFSSRRMSVYFDLYSARRSSVDQSFGPATPVANLNTAFDDVGAQLVGDASTLYFNYDTDLTGGRNADIWIATRACQ